MDTHRLSRLERRVRVQWIALGLVVTAFLAAVAAPTDDDGVLRARGLIIVDEAGRERILLGAPVPASKARLRTDATTSLVFLGEDGSDRVTVGDQPDPRIKGEVVPRIARGWGIVVNDDQGNERGGFGYIDNGRVVLGLDFAEKGEAITLAVLDGQYAAIMLNDENGHRERAGIYVGRDGPSVMKLGGPSGTRVVLKVEGDNPAELLLVDPSDWSTVDVMPDAPDS